LIQCLLFILVGDLKVMSYCQERYRKLDMFGVVLYVSREVDGECNRLEGVEISMFFFPCKRKKLVRTEIVLSFISFLEHGKYYFQMSDVIIV